MMNIGYRMTNKIVGQGFSLAGISILLTTILHLAISCHTLPPIEKAKNEKAKEQFLMNLNIVEESMKKRQVGGEELNTAIDVLEKVTAIRGHRVPDYGGYAYRDWHLFVQDFKRWKDWYEKNKDRLYWDEREKKIIVRER